jgi:hypothetical protein
VGSLGWEEDPETVWVSLFRLQVGKKKLSKLFQECTSGDGIDVCAGGVPHVLVGVCV